tara:strand:- start:81642 stop:81971 length:330 start_codon:yes stop_codon:yes gene_type:complete
MGGWVCGLVSGFGFDVGLVLILVGAPASVRWVGGELVWQKGIAAGPPLPPDSAVVCWMGGRVCGLVSGFGFDVGLVLILVGAPASVRWVGRGAGPSEKHRGGAGAPREA